MQKVGHEEYTVHVDRGGHTDRWHRGKVSEHYQVRGSKASPFKHRGEAAIASRDIHQLINLPAYHGNVAASFFLSASPLKLLLNQFLHNSYSSKSQIIIPGIYNLYSAQYPLSGEKNKPCQWGKRKPVCVEQNSAQAIKLPKNTSSV